MKKLLIIGAIIFSLASCGGDHMAANSYVPGEVFTSFRNDFPYAKNVDWDVEDGFYEASFKDMDGRHKDAYYDASGHLMKIDI